MSVFWQSYWQKAGFRDAFSEHCTGGPSAERQAKDTRPWSESHDWKSRETSCSAPDGILKPSIILSVQSNGRMARLATRARATGPAILWPPQAAMVECPTCRRQMFSRPTLPSAY